MKWYKHDADAHRDAKMKKVIRRYGAEGYALYFYCLELIAGKVTTGRVSFELEDDAENIGFELKIDQVRVEEMMKYFVDLGLFECSEGIITCLKLAARLDGKFTRDPELKSIIEAQKKTSPDCRGQTETIRDKGRPSPNVPDCPGLDKTRLDKTRKETSGRFTPPTFEEVRDYCRERGNNVDPETFVSHYEASNWFRGKTKIKNWKACVHTWEKRDNENNRGSNTGGGRAGKSDAIRGAIFNGSDI